MKKSYFLYKFLCYLFAFYSTFIARPSSSWVDDYFDWSSIKECCKYFPGNESYCPHDSKCTELLKINLTIKIVEVI